MKTAHNQEWISGEIAERIGEMTVEWKPRSEKPFRIALDGKTVAWCVRDEIPPVLQSAAHEATID